MDMTMFRRRGLLLNTPHIVNESGSIVTFASAYNKIPIKSLICNIEPIQSGSGDPSPDNVRPISGRTGLTVSHSGADTSDPATISVNWQTEAGTVYGAKLDVLIGKLTVNAAYVLYDGSSDENWAWTIATNRASIGVPQAKTSESRYPAVCCNMGTFLQTGHAVGGVFVGTDKKLWYYPPATVTNLESYLAWLSENNLQVVYELDNPIVYQLSANEIRTLLGENNIWCDSGDVSVDYWKWGK